MSEINSLYSAVLGLKSPWSIDRVETELAAGEVHVWVALPPNTRWVCPTCLAPAPIHDHQDRSWRHLDTCQFHTIVHARVPRLNCPTHGIRQLEVPPLAVLVIVNRGGGLALRAHPTLTPGQRDPDVDLAGPELHLDILDRPGAGKAQQSGVQAAAVGGHARLPSEGVARSASGGGTAQSAVFSHTIPRSPRKCNHVKRRSQIPLELVDRRLHTVSANRLASVSVRSRPC